MVKNWNWKHNQKGIKLAEKGGGELRLYSSMIRKQLSDIVFRERRRGSIGQIRSSSHQ